MDSYRFRTRGFTLIELSIVLVIIGLIVGGVLVGRDFIDAAKVRTQISQIEKYNTAANTFRGKYGYLPGDIPGPNATQLGFAARDGSRGLGDGNGIIEGSAPGLSDTMCGITQTNFSGSGEAYGETVLFWVDLSKAGMLEGSFTQTTNLSFAALKETSSPALHDVFPRAKSGQATYVYVWSGGYCLGDGINYFGVSGILDFGFYATNPTKTLTVSQAYNMDTKVDDGLPQSGTVLAIGVMSEWASSPYFGVPVGAANMAQTSASATGCYDNGNVAGATEQYSTSTYPNNVSCYLSFKFQ
jgi:prepilin-type N-terminal cleavage/methylation domain-containing protein